MYAGIPKLSDTIRTIRLKLAWHCLRSEEAVADLVLWTPRHGKRRPGRPAATYFDILKKDTGLKVNSILRAMSDRDMGRHLDSRSDGLDLNKPRNYS